MNKYKAYAENISGLGSTLTWTTWAKLTYITAKSEWLTTYTNYISSKFFPKKNIISQYDINERIAIIESALHEYTALQHEITIDEDIDQDLKSFLIRKIKENTTQAEIAKRATLFEAEKSGYDILFTWSTFEIKKNQEKIQSMWLNEAYESKKNIYLKEMNDLQDQVYGPKISNSADERQLVVSMCNARYQKNKQKLSNQEQILFASFLKNFKDDITPNIPQSQKRLPSRGKLSMSTIMKGTEHIKNYFYPDIQRWQVKEKGKVWYSAPFSKKIREYPDKDEDFFNKILTTIGHEDGGHMVRSDNQKKNGMIIAGPGYENIEEWITVLNEWLLRYSLDEYPLIPSDTFISVFIGENYNFENTYHIIKAFKKLTASGEIPKEKEDLITKTAFNLTKRVKCYYPRDEKGSNRKDVIYFRGEKKFIEYLKSLPNDEERAEFYRKAMSAKVSFEDIFLLDNLLKKIWATGNINHNKLVDKVCNVKLQQWAWAFSKTINEQWTMSIEENLLKWDFRFRGMEQYTQEEKKALVDVFTMVGYKKYRGKYIQQEERNKLKARDQLKKWTIISISTGEWVKKAKVLSSSFDELKIIIQKDWRYSWWKIISIQKKDMQTVWNIRILNKRNI